jgi:hypothetical protein
MDKKYRIKKIFAEQVMMNSEPLRKSFTWTLIGIQFLKFINVKVRIVSSMLLIRKNHITIPTLLKEILVPAPEVFMFQWSKKGTSSQMYEEAACRNPTQM